jgi:predicted aspartyl protease/tetratricopeptide (TPR) repeat protein
MRVPVSAVLVSLAFAIFARPAVAGCELGQLAQLAVTMKNGAPLIDARINGKDVKLILDSGAHWSTLTFATAQELQLDLSQMPVGIQIRGVGGAAKARLSRVKEFTLATAPLKNVDFVIVSSGGQAGLLGQNILSALDVEYDLPNGFVRLFKAKDCKEASLAYWAKDRGSSMTRMYAEDGRRTYTTIPVVVNGQRLRAMVDTGASVSLLTRKAAMRAGVPSSGPDVTAANSIMGVGGRTEQSWIARIDSFKIADEEVRNPRIRVADVDMGFDMLLGADFLISHRMYVSNEYEKVYFTYEGGAIFDASPKAFARTETGDLEDFEAVEQADPTDAAGFARRAAIQLEHNQWDAAIADLSRAIELEPETAEWFQRRAEALLRAKRLADATTDIERAIALKPVYPEAFLVRGLMKLVTGDKAGSLADMQTASGQASAQSDIRLQLGGALTDAGRPDLAIVEYTAWLQAHLDDGRQASALNGRCWARGLANVELAEARQDCERALGRTPGAVNILDSLGLVRLRMGDYEAAVKTYSTVLAKDPSIAWSLFGRSLALRALGRTAEADADLAAATAASPGIVEEAKTYGIQ